MRTSEIHTISKVIKNEYFYLSDPVRLIIPKLLMYATNELDFFTLLELSKRDSIRNLILKTVREDSNPREKLAQISKRRKNKSLIQKTNFALIKFNELSKIN